MNRVSMTEGFALYPAAGSYLGKAIAGGRYEVEQTEVA